MANERPNNPAIRRIVTGHDANGVAKVIRDGPATNAKYPAPGIVSTLVWCTDATPADITVGETVESRGEFWFRWYTRGELENLLELEGFHITDYWGSFGREPFGQGSEQQVVRAVA